MQNNQIKNINFGNLMHPRSSSKQLTNLWYRSSKWKDVKIIIIMLSTTNTYFHYYVILYSYYLVKYVVHHGFSKLNICTVLLQVRWSMTSITFWVKISLYEAHRHFIFLFIIILCAIVKWKKELNPFSYSDKSFFSFNFDSSFYPK